MPPGGKTRARKITCATTIGHEDESSSATAGCGRRAGTISTSLLKTSKRAPTPLSALLYLDEALARAREGTGRRGGAALSSRSAPTRAIGAVPRIDSHRRQSIVDAARRREARGLWYGAAGADGRGGDRAGARAARRRPGRDCNRCGAWRKARATRASCRRVRDVIFSEIISRPARPDKAIDRVRSADLGTVPM